MTRVVLLSLAVALALGTLPVAASTFVAMTPRELIGQADAVIQGEVVELSSFWSESGRIIVSEAVVEVHETLVGQSSSTVTVRTFGGQVGDVRVDAHGFPAFERGEKVLLFLAEEPAAGTLRVLGYRQGQFRVVQRRDGVTLAVPMIEEGTRYITRNGQLMPEARSLEIGTFKARVRSIAQALGRQIQSGRKTESLRFEEEE